MSTSKYGMPKGCQKCVQEEVARLKMERLEVMMMELDEAVLLRSMVVLNVGEEQLGPREEECIVKSNVKIGKLMNAIESLLDDLQNELQK